MLPTISVSRYEKLYAAAEDLAVFKAYDIAFKSTATTAKALVTEEVANRLLKDPLRNCAFKSACAGPMCYLSYFTHIRVLYFGWATNLELDVPLSCQSS